MSRSKFGESNVMGRRHPDDLVREVKAYKLTHLGHGGKTISKVFRERGYRIPYQTINQWIYGITRDCI